MGHKPPVVECNAEKRQDGEIGERCVKKREILDSKHMCILYVLDTDM